MYVDNIRGIEKEMVENYERNMYVTFDTFVDHINKKLSQNYSVTVMIDRRYAFTLQGNRLVEDDATGETISMYSVYNYKDDITCKIAIPKGERYKIESNDSYVAVVKRD